MTNILLLMWKTYCNNFKFQILSKKEKYFCHFFAAFLKFTLNFQYLCISESIDWKKTRLLKCLKSPVSEHRSVVDVLKDP